METEIVFCDNCNLEHDSQLVFPIPDEWAVSLRLPVGTVMSRGTFTGNFVQAQQHGWQERDYGHICPPCVLEEQAVAESGETQALSIDETLKMFEPPKVSENEN